MASPVLSLRGVSKRFGPVQANDDITIEFRAGEIHALLGENGSGKSTLLSIASGSLAPDSGTVDIAGERLPSASPRAAMRLGLGMAYQHLTAVAGLTVAENLYLGAPDHIRPGYSHMYGWATEKLAQLRARRHGGGPDRDLVGRPAADARSRVGAAPATEGAAARRADNRARPRRRAAPARADPQTSPRSGMGIVYVSHRLPEVLDVADRVTVLRDGVSQGTYAAATMSEADVVAMMIGRPLETAFPTIAEAPPGDTLLAGRRS